MEPGEKLIEASLPSNMITPRWTGSEWEETATPEQIEAAKPEPLPSMPPSDIELLAVEITSLLSTIEAAQKYATELNRQETGDWYWKVIEVIQ